MRRELGLERPLGGKRGTHRAGLVGAARRQAGRNMALGNRCEPRARPGEAPGRQVQGWQRLFSSRAVSVQAPRRQKLGLQSFDWRKVWTWVSAGHWEAEEAWPVEAGRRQELRTGEAAVRWRPGRGRVRCEAKAGTVYGPSGGKTLGPERLTRGSSSGPGETIKMPT